mmetsp:Transcript_35717/g.102633  ORF Transcript_35717/g.102633 Transcript_35717/m.102633 type:complete len:202 (-) Transcript_35717:346-951(-)
MLSVQFNEGLHHRFGSRPLFESALHVVRHRLDPIFVQRLQNAHQGRAEAFGPHALKYSRSLRIGRNWVHATALATAATAADRAVPCSALPVSGSRLAVASLRIIHHLPAATASHPLGALAAALSAASSGLVEELVSTSLRGRSVTTIGIHALCGKVRVQAMMLGQVSWVEPAVWSLHTLETVRRGRRRLQVVLLVGSRAPV